MVHPAHQTTPALLIMVDEGGIKECGFQVVRWKALNKPGEGKLR